MQRAHGRGNLREARVQAKELLAHTNAADPTTEEERAAAEAMMRRLEPDAFLLVVGALGLGLTVWLVYNYML